MKNKQNMILEYIIPVDSPALEKILFSRKRGNFFSTRFHEFLNTDLNVESPDLDRLYNEILGYIHGQYESGAIDYKIRTRATSELLELYKFRVFEE